MADFQIIKQKLMLYYVQVFLIRNIIFQILMTDIPKVNTKNSKNIFFKLLRRSNSVPEWNIKL